MKKTAVDYLFEKLWGIHKDKFTWQMILQEAKKKEIKYERQTLISLLDWMNKVAQDNPMVFETDSEDIVDMYLQSVNQENQKI